MRPADILTGAAAVDGEVLAVGALVLEGAAIYLIAMVAATPAMTSGMMTPRISGRRERRLRAV